MNEKEWVEKHLSHRTRGWEDLVLSGRVSLEELEDGPLKIKLETYARLMGEIETMLVALEYDVG